MGLNRRALLEGACAVLALLGFSRPARGEGWPGPAFEATASDDALGRLFGSERPQPSNAIEFRTPVAAEDGSVVPVSVRTALPGVTSISLVVERNPRPLAAHFELAPGTLPEIACRIKMAETSAVHAVVQTESGLYSAAGHVRITNGGCA